MLRGEGQFLSSVVAQARRAVVALSEDLLDRRQSAAFWTRRGVSHEVQFCQRLFSLTTDCWADKWPVWSFLLIPRRLGRLGRRVAVLLRGADYRPAKAGEAPCVGGPELVAPRGFRAGGLLQHVGPIGSFHCNWPSSVREVMRTRSTASLKASRLPRVAPARRDVRHDRLSAGVQLPSRRQGGAAVVSLRRTDVAHCRSSSSIRSPSPSIGFSASFLIRFTSPTS